MTKSYAKDQGATAVIDLGGKLRDEPLDREGFSIPWNPFVCMADRTPEGAPEKKGL